MKHKIVEKTKKQLLSDLKQKDVRISRHHTKEELHHLALANKVALTFVEPVIILGWFGKPKGLLQVLWERDWINVEEIDRYSIDGKGEYKDENGQVKKEYQRYVLRTLMKNCRAFKEEKSAMKALLLNLTSKSYSSSVQLLCRTSGMVC